MNSYPTTIPTTVAGGLPRSRRPADRHRLIGVVARGRTYRSLAYLLAGAVLGTVSFSVMVSALAVGISLLAVALIGVPVLLVTGYALRACANAERSLARGVLGVDLPTEPLSAQGSGNLWVRLRAMIRDRRRRWELAYVMARFPQAIATATLGATALAVPGLVAYSPFAARWGGEEPFGRWAYSSELMDVASSGWAWLLVPTGVVLLIPALHLTNALARLSGRWTAAWLGSGRR